MERYDAGLSEKRNYGPAREGSQTSKKLKADYVEENMKHHKKRIMNEGTRRRKCVLGGGLDGRRKRVKVCLSG